MTHLDDLSLLLQQPLDDRRHGLEEVLGDDERLEEGLVEQGELKEIIPIAESETPFVVLGIFARGNDGEEGAYIECCLQHKVLIQVDEGLRRLRHVRVAGLKLGELLELVHEDLSPSTRVSCASSLHATPQSREMDLDVGHAASLGGFHEVLDHGL